MTEGKASVRWRPRIASCNWC